VTARDILYGRGGGRWQDTARPIPDSYEPRPQDLSPLTLFHPQTRARNIAHRDRPRVERMASCPAAGKGGHVDDCTCEPDPAVLEDLWRGAARMAKARRDAGESLSATDRQALDRYPTPTMTGADHG
jgi:hypothetical protein